MHLDWMIGLGIFLVSFSLAFSWIIPQLPLEKPQYSGVLESYLKNLSVRCWTIPARDDGKGERILYTVLPFKSESQAVFSSASALPCLLQGDRLYWKAGPDQKNFTIYLTENPGRTCNASLNITNATRAETGVTQPEERISLKKLEDFLGHPAPSNLRLVFSLEEKTFTWGPQPPQDAEVRVIQGWRRVEETGEIMNIRLEIW